jgi:hypothetical protein
VCAGRARASRRNERHRGTFREDERRTFLAAQTKPSKYGHVSAVRVIARVLLKVESAHVLRFFNRWHASILSKLTANLSLSLVLHLTSICYVIAVPECVHFLSSIVLLAARLYLYLHLYCYHFSYLAFMSTFTPLRLILFSCLRSVLLFSLLHEPSPLHLSLTSHLYHFLYLPSLRCVKRS